MKLTQTVFGSLLFCSSCFATTWTVDDDMKADFNTIQAAVDAASNGDEIVVMPGTYTSIGDEVVNMLGKLIWLHSSNGASVTFIDGQDVRRGITCNSGETSETTIDGFTIIHGNAPNGGGIIAANGATIMNCTLANNEATSASGYGGGIYATGGSTISNCSFTENHAFFNGGGLLTMNSTVVDCIFTDNTADLFGEGLYSPNSATTLMNCSFVNNDSTFYGNYIINPFTSEDPLAPCCVPTGCTDVSNADCSALGGLWLGISGSCIECKYNQSCKEDLDGDGLVNVADLLSLITAWGACP